MICWHRIWLFAKYDPVSVEQERMEHATRNNFSLPVSLHFVIRGEYHTSLSLPLSFSLSSPRFGRGVLSSRVRYLL